MLWQWWIRHITRHVNVHRTSELFCHGISGDALVANVRLTFDHCGLAPIPYTGMSRLSSGCENSL